LEIVDSEWFAVSYSIAQMGGEIKGLRVQGSGFRVSPWGAPSFDYMRKRFSGFNRFSGFKGGGAAHKNQKRRRV